MKLALEFSLPDEDGWDGHLGKPPTEQALDTVKALHLTPLSDGGLLLEMHSGGVDFEVEIDSDGKVGSVSTEWREP